MPSGRDPFTFSLMGQSALARFLFSLVVIVLLWAAIRWSVLLP